MVQKNKIISSNFNEIISNELINKTLDVGIDYSELALDAFLKDNILKEIPFVKSVV